MGNKNYNNFYNNNNHGNGNHNHVVPNVETPVEEIKPIESEIEKVEDTIVESTDPSTVETTPIPGINENSEETESKEEIQNESDEILPVLDEEENIKQVKVVIKKLNIRKEPNKDSEVLAVVEENKIMALCAHEDINGFYQVMYGEHAEIGYCMKEFVELV